LLISKLHTFKSYLTVTVNLKKTNYKLIFLSYIPIGIILFLILKSELRTEGSFGGLFDFFKYLLFLISGIVVFVYTSIKQRRKIKKRTEIKEAKIILTSLLASALIAVSSFYFPNDIFYREPEFVAKDNLGTELKLADGKYMLKTHDYEWTNIDRGLYKNKNNIIVLEGEIKEIKWGKRARKYLIKNENLIPIYSSGIETDSINFLPIQLNKK